MASQSEATKTESVTSQKLDLDDVGDVPDPDEDDLDDLDGMRYTTLVYALVMHTLADCSTVDMLDDFNDVKIDSSKPAVAASTSADPPADVKSQATAGSTTTKSAEEEVLSNDDFAKQLQAGMAELMGEIENSVI